MASRSKGQKDGGATDGKSSKQQKVLSLDVLQHALDGVERTVNGTGFAFSKLSIPDEGLEDIALLRGYVHVRYLVARDNSVSDISPLVKMSSLVSADIAGNAIHKLVAFPNRFLQVLDVSRNQLVGLAGFAAPMLTYLKLDSNKITSLAGISNCKLLQRLDVNDNLLESTADIEDLPALQMLQLGDNAVTTVVGLGTLPALEVLNLCGNNIDNLEGFTDACEHLKVSGPFCPH